MKGFKVSIFCSFVNLLYVFVCFNLFLIKIPYVPTSAASWVESQNRKL